MIAKHLTQTFILTCCRLTLIYCITTFDQISDFEIYTVIITI